MIAVDAVALLLLAAGRSTRFGPRDKLAALLDGRPLGWHAATMLSGLGFAARIAVVRRASPDWSALGYAAVVNPDPDAGQSGSIRLGLAEALRHKPDAVLVVLADMPFVTAAHVEALLARCDATHPIVASTDGIRKGPPVLFAASLFPALAAVSGDAGARTLLRDATLVEAPAEQLVDVDTPDDLRLAEARLRAR